MVRTQGTGRKKIDIRKIENKLHLKTTFTKRRKGLFKKVQDFCASSGTKAAVFTFSPFGRAYGFGSPSDVQVIQELYAEEEEEDAINGESTSAEVCEETCSGFWWRKPVEDVEFSEIDDFMNCLLEYKQNLILLIEDMRRRTQALKKLI